MNILKSISKRLLDSYILRKQWWKMVNGMTRLKTKSKNTHPLRLLTKYHHFHYHHYRAYIIERIYLRMFPNTLPIATHLILKIIYRTGATGILNLQVKMPSPIKDQETARVTQTGKSDQAVWLHSQTSQPLCWSPWKETFFNGLNDL